MLIRFHFADGTYLEMHTVEFGHDGMGAELDRWASQRGGITEVTVLS